MRLNFIDCHRYVLLFAVLAFLQSHWSHAQTCPTSYTPTNVTGTGSPKEWSNSSAWATGGIAGTDNGTTVTLGASSIVVIENSDFNLTNRNLVVNGILFINGKLNLTAGYSITINSGAILCCASPCNNSDKLRIGTTQIWQGSDGNIAGPASSNGGPLPVEILFFKASTVDGGIKLDWATGGERNAHYFSIEKSNAGGSFTEIGRVFAVGNTIARQDYSFRDENALLGRNYYRLKQVDIDGSFEYFNVTFADTEGEKAVIVYPNPVQDQQIQIKLNFSSDNNVDARIYNSHGQVVGKLTFFGTHYTSKIDLTPGTYLLKVSVGSDQFTQRFIVP